jgi:hypothetical protein
MIIVVDNTETSDSKSEKNNLWEELGFHRPLAGFWYKLVFEIGILIIPIFFVTYFLKYIYPFPTSIGYRATFTSLFVLVFTIFDIGTANTISRYIADENVKNPLNMVKYVQYFIWYQSITGIIQITVISIWALYFVPNTELAYGIWIMLLCITKQWPGFPGVFKGVLGSLQQYNKKATIDFIQSEAVQRFTEIGFVLLGKWYGESNPEVGAILGIAMGAVIGLYLDDVIASVFAGWFLAKSLKNFGITFKRLFKIEFDWKIVKECLTFGLKTGLPSVLFAFTKVFVLTLCLQYIPQYTTFYVLYDMAYMLVAVTERLVNQDFTPLLTESYQSQKVKLCQYYNAHSIRFMMINTGFAFAIMLLVISMLEGVFIGLQLDRYMLSLPFLIPVLIYRGFKPYNRYSDSLLIAAHKPNMIMGLKIFEEIIKIISWYLTIVVFRVYELGIVGIVYTLALGDFPAILIKNVIAYVYINKKVMKLKVMAWQSFVVPPVSTGILYGVFLLLKILFIDLLFSWNFWGALVIGLLFIFILVFVLYFPLTVLLGGWDDNSVEDFKKVVTMAGPSRFIISPMSKIILKIIPHSKLHNKFKYDEREAFEELEDLIKIRQGNIEKSIKIESANQNQ